MNIGYENKRQGNPAFQKQRAIPKHNLNHQIKSNQVRIIVDHIEGSNPAVNGSKEKGASKVVSLHEALKMAEDMRVDLIEINAKASPPICKLMDYGKFIYKSQKSIKKEKKSKAKEIGFHVNIASHDFETKMRQAKEFLNDNCPITFKIQFRGRECAHKEIGISLFEKVSLALAHQGRQDGTPKVNGKFAMLRVCPLAKNR
jgi:translation initiation factor IF-3